MGKRTYVEVGDYIRGIGLALDKIQGLRDSRGGKDHPSRGFHVGAYFAIGETGIEAALRSTEDKANNLRGLDGIHTLDAAAYFGRVCKNMAAEKGVEL